MEKRIDSISKEHVAALKDLLQKKTGLFFPESKFLSLTKDIITLFQHAKVESFAKYILFISSKKGEEHFKKLISLFTTNETFFFRVKSQFDVLKEHILPELIAHASERKEISIWSAGCSTGEEPYSLAIIIKDLIPDITKWKINIIASDIDEAALTKAKIGQFGKWSFRGVDKKIIKKCFKKIKDDYVINDEYKSMVRFVSHNLVSDASPEQIDHIKNLDLIVCRNVTIYFDKKTTKKLGTKFYDLIRDQGYLLVGPAEHSAEYYGEFKSKVFPDAIIYKKVLKDESENAGSSGSKAEGEGNKDIIDTVLEQETLKLLNVIQQHDLSLLYTKEKLTLHENRKDANSKEETLVFDEALKHFNNKKFDLAIDRFLRVLDVNPSNARACWMLSHIYASKGSHDEAIAWGGKCIEIDPLYKDSYYTLCLSLIAKGELEEAAEKIKKAIYIDPKFTLGYFTLGNIYILMHLNSQAIKYKKKANTMFLNNITEELSFHTKNVTVAELLKVLQLKARSI